jgi:hypothetical protein
VQAASENGSFTVSTATTARYGVDSRWTEKAVSGTTACSNAFFGDPAVGTGKSCYVPIGTLFVPAPPPPPPPPPAPTPAPVWTRAADEGASFTVPSASLLRFGNGTRWLQLTTSAGNVSCTAAFFGGDPAGGTTKQCDVQPAGADIAMTVQTGQAAMSTGDHVLIPFRPFQVLAQISAPATLQPIAFAVHADVLDASGSVLSSFPMQGPSTLPLVSAPMASLTGNYQVTIPAASVVNWLARVRVSVDDLTHHTTQSFYYTPTAVSPPARMHLILVPVRRPDGSITYPVQTTAQIQAALESVYPFSLHCPAGSNASDPARPTEHCISVDVHAPVTMNGSGDTFSQQDLTDVTSLGYAEGVGMYDFYMALQPGANHGIAYIPGFSSAVSGWGNDASSPDFGDAFNVGQVIEEMSHELGHNFGQPHTFPDSTNGNTQSYPFADQLMHSTGVNLNHPGSNAAIDAPVLKSGVAWGDIMSYQNHSWVSDYTFNAIYQNAASWLPGPIGWWPRPASPMASEGGRKQALAASAPAAAAQPTPQHLLRIAATPGSGEFTLQADELVTSRNAPDALLPESMLASFSSSYWLKLTMADGTVGWVRPRLQELSYPPAAKMPLTHVLTAMIPPELEVQRIELRRGTQVIGSTAPTAATPQQRAALATDSSALASWDRSAAVRNSSLAASVKAPIDVTVVNGQITARWSGPYALTLVRVDGDGRRTGVAVRVSGPSITLPGTAPTAGGHWEASLYDGLVKRTFSLDPAAAR